MAEAKAALSMVSGSLVLSAVAQPHTGTSIEGIMSASTGPTFDPWRWSTCSQSDVESFLDNVNPTCLDDAAGSPIDASVPSTDRLPGEYFDLEAQCEMQRPNSLPDPDSLTTNLVCNTLKCRFSEGGNEFVQSVFSQWLDGTRCGLTDGIVADQHILY